MNARCKTLTLLVAFVAANLWAFAPALANGGPFVVKYPGGDPSAKGILARLDPSLRPAREERLRVLRENLEISFAATPEFRANSTPPPLVTVEAAYIIENPTDEEISVDFGFPILRGLYINPFSMARRPAVSVRLNERSLPVNIISNSAIYGIIRQQARVAIEQAIAGDAALAQLVATLRATKADDQAARAALARYLADSLHWDPSDVALMVAYASLDFGVAPATPPPGFWGWGLGRELVTANLGPLAAIGEQKATQFFAVLAARFELQVAATYESIFEAWGGDVRERAVDLKTGQLRPREISVATADSPQSPYISPADDPTVYARVDYLDPNAKLSEAELASCKMILKNLPVIFTFAPMNLLHYRATFSPQETHALTVTYQQFAYADTAEPSSYQLAYVVHPASLWKEFGPINLTVAVPDSMPFQASVRCERRGTEYRDVPAASGHVGGSRRAQYALYQATLEDKTGELFVAVGADAWKKKRLAAALEGSEKEPHGTP